MAGAENNTHHSFDKVEVFGHHVIEVVSDEDSPHEQLRHKQTVN